MAKGLITFDQYVQEKGFDDKTVNRFWKYCNQDIPNKETGQIEWWGRDVTNHNDMRGYSEEFDELFNEFKNINSSRKIQSSYSEYRVGDEVILKTEGDSASRRVTKVIDPNCELRIGDSVSDFSNNVDYLNDVYGGRFVIVPYDRYIQSSRQIKSARKYPRQYTEEQKAWMGMNGWKSLPLSFDDIYEGAKFENENGVICEILKVEPQYKTTDGTPYVLFKFNDEQPKDTTLDGIINMLSGNGYESINSSRQIKSSLPAWAKSLSDDDAERRNQLQELYNEAHWEFLDYTMPCDPEWTPDMADGDFNPLSEIHFLFENASEIESFLANCDYAGIPGAEEKLKRMRQINTWNEAYASGPHPETWEDWSSVQSSKQIQSKLDTVKVTFDNGDTIVTDYNADVGREEIAKYYMHNYFNVGGEDEMHQVVKVEFPDSINSARTPEVADMQDAEDLALFAENDHELYDMVIKPTFDSLQRKLKRGIYDKDKALIAWEHVIDEAAKAYDRQLGSKRGTMTMFNKATRKEAAKILMDSIWDEDEWQA